MEVYFQMKAGDKLEIFIFGFIVILILIPILYIVPVSFNKKEKLLIAGLSFVLAELGLFTNKYLPLWKSILILLLLALIFTYFFETRLRPHLEKAKNDDKDSLKKKRRSRDFSKNEVNHIEKPKLEENKDFGDFNLGQEAIDRLLFEKQQSKLINDSMHIEELTANKTIQGVELEDENLQLTSQPVLSENQNNTEDLGGVIEDSYNNTELYSDFVEVQHLEKDKQEINIEKEIEEAISVDEEPLNFEEAKHDFEVEPELLELDLNKLSDEQNEQVDINELQMQDVLDGLLEENVQNDELGATDDADSSLSASDEQVDLEELLSGQHDANDIVDVEKNDVIHSVDLGDESLDASSSSENEDELELLQRRSALFDVLDGEAIIEEEKLFIEDHNDINEELIDDLSDIEPIDFDLEKEEIIRNEEQKINQDVLTEAPIENIADMAGNIEVISEIGTFESSEINFETIAPLSDEKFEEILDINEDITTSVNTEENSTMSNDIYVNSEIQNDVVIDAVSAPKETKTQQQMLQTMLDYINLSKPSLSKIEYEELVRAHMHSELSDHDYYTFAYLLIEHYISQEQYGKLSSLLQDLDSKFSKYPILKQQLNYLFERYC